MVFEAREVVVGECTPRAFSAAIAASMLGTRKADRGVLGLRALGLGNSASVVPPTR